MFEGEMNGVKMMESGTSVRDSSPNASLANSVLERAGMNVSVGPRSVDEFEYGLERTSGVQSDDK